MNDIQRLHQQAMDWAEQAEVAKRRGESLDHVQALLKQAFDQETLAADHLVDALEVEPTRSVIHRSAAALAIDCGDFPAAERLITRALMGNPPAEVAAELKDLFMQINLTAYFERRGLHLDMQQLTLSEIA
jgi:hypothetical protein